MVSLQSVMVAKHFNCVHITPDNLVVESDSKAAKKVQVGTSSKKPKVLYKHWSKEKMVLLGSIHATKAGQGQRK